MRYRVAAVAAVKVVPKRVDVRQSIVKSKP